MIDTNDPGTLLHGDDLKTANMLKICPKTIKRWKTGKNRIPEAVKLLMKFIKWGDLSGIGGKEWEGFTIGWQDKKFYIPAFKDGFTPGQLNALFFRVQDAWMNKRDLKNTTKLLKECQEKLELSEKNNKFYKEQLKEAGKQFIWHFKE